MASILRSAIKAATIFALAFTTLASKAEQIVAAESITIRSSILNEERRIFISLPKGYQSSKEKYPVIYLTDGGRHTLLVRAIADHLASNGMAPEVIVVGVDNTDRDRDLTPVPGHYFIPSGTRVDVKKAGGNDFLNMFEKELFPYVEANYRVEKFRAQLGHSLGGLLALHTYATRPYMFAATVAASPTLDWADGYTNRLLKEYLSKQTSKPHPIYVSTASEERVTKVESFFQLKAILGAASDQKLLWKFSLLENEDHGSMVFTSYYEGLRHMFQGWKIPAGANGGLFDGSQKDIAMQYEVLSKRLGYVAKPEENAINLLAYGWLQSGRAMDALALFQWNTQIYPGSPNTFDSLGECQEILGKRQEAIESYTKAVQLAVQLNDPRVDLFKATLQRIQTSK